MTKGQIYAEFILDALIRKGVARFDAYRDIQRVAFSAIESSEHFFDAVSNDGHYFKQVIKAGIGDYF